MIIKSGCFKNVIAAHQLEILSEEGEPMVEKSLETAYDEDAFISTLRDEPVCDNVMANTNADIDRVRQQYKSLSDVLVSAYDQASGGKGKERHANNNPFEDQPICEICRTQKSIDFATGQAIKKCYEVTNLPTTEAKVRELLGAINYIAAAIIVLREENN